jgi:hypothetical protein
VVKIGRRLTEAAILSRMRSPVTSRSQHPLIALQGEDVVGLLVDDFLRTPGGLNAKAFAPAAPSQMPRPCVHQFTPPHERVRSAVGLFGLVADYSVVYSKINTG